MAEIDIFTSLPTSKVHFIINPFLWDSFDATIKTELHSVPVWAESKFLTENGEINPEMNNIPSNSGGIYLFVAKPNLIPNTHSYLLYVGRAHFSSAQNLKKRCREYIKEKSRPKVKRMIDSWGQYLYVRYLPLTNNELIDSIEAEIINKIIPPFNDSIPDKQIRDAVKAFTV